MNAFYNEFQIELDKYFDATAKEGNTWAVNVIWPANSSSIFSVQGLSVPAEQKV
jgi:hypothetical protein